MPKQVIESDDTQFVDVKTESIRFLYQSASMGLIVNLLLSSLMTAVLWEQVEHERLIYWFTVLAVLTVIRAFTVLKFNKKTDYTLNVHIWYSIFITLSTLSGLLWGMSIWFFAPYNDLIAPLVLVFALGGLTAGAAATLGSVLRVYFLYIWMVILPSLFWFYLQPSGIYSILSIMLTIYIVAMMAAGYIYRKVLIKSIMVSNDLVEAKNNAEVANRAKTKFLSSMSHEFRTPLNAILGFAQLLELDEKTLNKEQRENVDFILVSGQHLLNLVNDILDLSKAEASNIHLVIDDVNLNVLLEECIPLIQESALKQELEINNNINNDDIIVRADKTKLKQVILNLLSNATKYNRKGGSITLSSYESKDSYLRVEIKDTGKGISIKNKAKLFTAFERLDHENSNVEGTGLGLVVTKQIIEAMNGNIGLYSQEGEGSTFWIEIPLAV